MTQHQNAAPKPNALMRFLSWFTPVRRIVIVFGFLVILTGTAFFVEVQRDGWSAPGTPWMFCAAVGVLVAMRVLVVLDRRDAEMRTRVIGGLIGFGGTVAVLALADLIIR
ncbi:hypothetical protein [Leucobacter sp. M11]|uniref:hypothetical protein n=1 Tax=Leucobacter sp. M11 TaxID=2993565 RepID=UPI002D7F1DE4|nr:hypothetical protein [Leucobacter sp. M11]MEB4613805.1 hypothetical protein [Leucobacter sp. M11]